MFTTMQSGIALTGKGGMIMADREKVIKEFELFIKEFHPACTSEGVELDMLREVLFMLKKQEDLGAEQHPQELVRCKDCVHRGKIEKCVLAAIAAEKGYPLFMLDNRGEWFCADAKRAT